MLLRPKEAALLKGCFFRPLGSSFVCKKIRGGVHQKEGLLQESAPDEEKTVAEEAEEDLNLNLRRALMALRQLLLSTLKEEPRILRPLGSPASPRSIWLYKGTS